MAMRIEIDQDECMSAGKCVADYPAAFGFDDVELVVGRPGLPELDEADMVRVVRNCPSGALRLIES